MITPEEYVDIIQGHIRKHLATAQDPNKPSHYLYRTFFYDCAPLDLKIHAPLPEGEHSRKPFIKFAERPENQCRLALLEALKTQRKVALRLGKIKHQRRWKLTDKAEQDLLSSKLKVDDLTNDHFYFEAQQKGVDIKLGVDIATLSYQKLVDQIILIAGDSDFVPAAKLARLNGIDFVLDSLHSTIDPSLNEHIDGLNSYDIVSTLKSVFKCDPDVKPNWWTGNTRSKRTRR